MKKQLLFVPVLLLMSAVSCKKDENNENRDDEFDLKASKMEQVGSLFNAIAMQPEAAGMLISSTTLLYNDYTELLPLSDKAVIQRGKARGAAFGMLFSSIARQPEAFNDLEAAAARYLGKYDPTYISDELLEITKAYCVTALNESIARQPEADSLFNVISKKYLNYDFQSAVK